MFVPLVCCGGNNRTAVGVSRAVAMALWCWYVLIVRCAALKARVVGGLLSVRASLSVLAVSQYTDSHTKLTGNTGFIKEPVLPPSNPAGPFLPVPSPQAPFEAARLTAPRG